VKLQVVISRFQGEKKIASAPYVLSSGDGPASLRVGVQVPLMYASKDAPGNVVYKSVGNNLDCRTDPIDDDRYKVACTIEQSALYPSDTPTAPRAGDTGLLPPLLRNFTSQATVYLRDGQTTQYTAATDPVTGEVVKVDITLEAAK
jgi:hypothetical protein